MRLFNCSQCSGFVPPLVSICPNCSARVGTIGGTLGRAALAVVGGGAMSMTLMACYGLPPCEITGDLDGDGYGTGSKTGGENCFEERLDCNEEDATINPSAEDLTVDGIDQNCDGTDGPVVAEGEGEGEGVGEGAN